MDEDEREKVLAVWAWLQTQCGYTADDLYDFRATPSPRRARRWRHLDPKTSPQAQQAVLDSYYPITPSLPMPKIETSFLDTLAALTKEKDGMSRIDGKEPEIHVVVGEQDLERAQQEGWRLVRVLTCDGPIRYFAKHTVFGDHSNNYVSQPEQHLEQVGTVLRFLLAKDRAHESAELRATIESMRLAAAEAEARTALLVRDSEKMATALAKAESSSLGAETRATANFKAQKEATEKWRLATNDLAKVRKAIGDLRMDEILGPTPF